MTRLPILCRELRTNGRGMPHQMLRFQGIWIVIAAIGAWLVWSLNEAVAVGAGGLCAMIPQMLFYTWAFRFRGARNARLIMRYFHLGEAIKIMLAIALVSVALSQAMFDERALISGFISTVITGQIIAPMLTSGYR